jgi:hypothetical protein
MRGVPGGRGVTENESDQALARAEELLAELETVRARLEATEDSDEAIEILTELADIAKRVEAELERARRAAAP